MFNIRMALEFENQVFNLSLHRIEDGVVYFHLEDVGVQIQRDMPRRGRADTDGQPEETQTLSPGAEEGAEAVPPPETRTDIVSGIPGGPEGEGIEPPPPLRQRGTRSTRARR
jgi:hypothetical protein